MKKLKGIKGVNLGNWLVLEKWMGGSVFESTDAEDEYHLAHSDKLSKEEYRERIKKHRKEFITEKDFKRIKNMGLNSVRIPVPFYIFDEDEESPYVSCAEELDKAFEWAEKYGLSILVDLHSVPNSQNGSPGSGYAGICRWAQDRKDVEKVLKVLEELAERYGHRKGLLGIEPINEPVIDDDRLRDNVSEEEIAKGSKSIPTEMLKSIYIEAYDRIMPHMGEDKYFVIHDAFQLKMWKNFMRESRYRNVVIDTHKYVVFADGEKGFDSIYKYLVFIYREYLKEMNEMKKYFPVICGEWCISNQYILKEGVSAEEKNRFLKIFAYAQLIAWKTISGYYFWTYKMEREDYSEWDLCRSMEYGWIPGWTTLSQAVQDIKTRRKMSENG